MLIEFRVENVLSFEQMTTLSMLATPDKEHEDQNVAYTNKLRILKSSAIYGANAAGKSNLINALGFMDTFVLYGSEMSKKTRLPDFSFKLDKKDEKRPSYFEVIFLQNEKRFRYGFEILDSQVASEWLFYTPTTREAMLFTRNNKEGIVTGASFKEASRLKAKPKDNQLFLSIVSGYNNDDSLSAEVIQWFQHLDITRVLNSRFNLGKTLHLLEYHDYKENLKDFLKKLDVLEDFDIRRVGRPQEFPDDMPEEVRSYFKSDEEEPTIVVKRKVYKDGKEAGIYEFDLLDEESEGTRKLFTLAGFFLDTLEHGGVLVVDELESNLHPLITRKVIKLFNSAENNPNGAQLIFATHDTNLLNNQLFRRDQVWFVEKHKHGASCLFSLAEYKDDKGKTRKDASFGKDYILGRYGAIPYLGDFDDLFGRND